jgi:hypothetical protein
MPRLALLYRPQHKPGRVVGPEAGRNFPYENVFFWRIRSARHFCRLIAVIQRACDFRRMHST